MPIPCTFPSFITQYEALAQSLQKEDKLKKQKECDDRYKKFIS